MSAKKCGLQISLMKYVLSEQGNNDTDNYILGYFDAMTMQTVKNWLDFSPGKSSAGINSQIISRYQIKLLFPREEVGRALEKYGCYSIAWQDLDNTDCNIFSENPCVSVILVNLTDQFKQLNSGAATHWNAYGDVLLRFGKLVNDLRIKEKLVKAHTCILPSVGYSDYCILLAEKNWDTAFELIRKLHRIKWKSSERNGRITLRCSNKEGAQPLLSTDYMMPVVHAPKGTAAIPTCGLTAHVNLAPGVSMEFLANKLGKDITVKQVSGPSDCILEAKPGAQQRLFDCLTLKDTSGLGGNLFVSTKASLQKKFARRAVADSIGIRPIDDNFEEIVSNFLHTLENYAENAKAERRHMRQVQAAKEIVPTIKNICNERHNSSFRNIIKPFIADFAMCLQTLTLAIQDSESSWEAKQAWFEQAENAIEVFRSCFGSFAADITRSDCFFMETEQYNHASISSNTSLILGYNRLINNFSEAVCKLVDPGADLRYSFIVTSGGCDRTHNINVFLDLDAEEEDGRIKEEHLPFLVRMSEMGLYDCNGTVLRLFHECSHYCGDRARKQRLGYMVAFLARIYGHILSNALLDKKGTADYLKQEIQAILPSGDWTENLGETIDGVHNQCVKELTDRLAALLKQAIKDGLKSVATYEAEIRTAQRSLLDNFDQLEEREQFFTIADCLGEVGCIGRKLQRHLRKILIELFYAYETDCHGHYSVNPFTRNVYAATLKAERSFYAGCYDNLRTVSPTLVICAYERRLRDAQIRKDTEYCREARIENDKVGGAANKSLEQRVIFALQRLIADGSLSEELEETSLKDLPSFGLAKQNVNSILNMVVEAFSETFADMAACTLLKASIEDYLFAFVFESWILDESLLLSTDMKFRIGITLRLCYADQLKGNGLSDGAKDRIRSGLQALEEYGMQRGRINANALIERIEEMIEGCAQMEQEAAPLQKYLQECKKKYDAWCNKPAIQRFQRIFDQMRLYRFQENNIHEQVISMVEAVTTGGVITDGETENGTDAFGSSNGYTDRVPRGGTSCARRKI